jgi:transposase-like protein
MSKQEFSMATLAARLHTEADAYLLLEELRWGGAPDACPHCGAMERIYFLTPSNGTARKTRTGSMSQRRVWKCGHCRKQFSVLTGTIFHGTKVSIRTWLLVIFDMCSAKNGIAAREVERKYGLPPKTAWFMLHRIREAMKREPLAGLLSGTIQADETWIGGDPKNRHRNDPRELARFYGTSDKTTVLALVHYETHEVRSQVIADVTANTLLEAMQEQADLGRVWLQTDSAKAYRGMAHHLPDHQYVNHAAGQYVGFGGVSTNLAESFFSQLKRSISGTFHHVSSEHLQRYLVHFDFMYTYCKSTDSQRMRRLLGQVTGRRLTYMPLTAR